MAFNGENVIYSSPIGRGSDGLSRNQTPSTVITSFSPEETRVRSEGHDRSSVQPKADATPTRECDAASDGDPFTFHPTAEEFKPGGNNNVVRVNLGSGLRTIPGIVPSVQKGTSSSPALGINLAAAARHHPTLFYQASPTRSVTVALTGQFTSNAPYSRTLLVQVDGNQSIDSVNAFIEEVMSSQFTNEVDMTEFSSRGKLILTFHDVRNAVLAAERCRILIPGALSVFLNAAGKSARHFLSDQADVENGPGDDSSKFEGEFVVAVSLIDPFEQHVAPGALENVAKDVVEKFGIKASQRLRVDPRGITMRIELFDVRPTHSKIFEAHDRRFGNFYVTVCHYLTWLRNPEGTGHSAHLQGSPSAYTHGFGSTSPYTYSQDGCSTYAHSQSSTAPYACSAQISPFSLSSPGYSPNSALAMVPRLQPAPLKHAFHPSTYASSHNQVNLERIRAGLDVRTTIMLRNIPNKVTHAMLKAIIDRTSLGDYDFMYLRIDFANNCNVGYAFINFSDPIHIVAFAAARAGKRWNTFNSDKVAEISYATIQGKDCLVSKFRNSSVMLEQPDYRPKLYRTGRGPDAGQEEEFPKPDNYMKMRRSCENAAHVGLYAPRLGQHFRSEQRYRRSQYDRGTMAAQAEAAATGFRELCCSCGRYHLDTTCAAALNHRRFA